MIRRSSPQRIAIYAVLGLWTIICLIPIYWLAVTSLRPLDNLDKTALYMPFVDFEPTLRAWKFILFDGHENLVKAALNTAFIAVTASLLSLVIGAMAAYGLTRFNYRLPWSRGTSANTAILWGILSTRVLPPVVIALPVYMMAQSMGLLDTPWALIVTYTAINIPVAVWLLQPVLGARASEQEEAAQLDGASHRLIFFTLVVPMAAGGIAAVELLLLTLCWNEYLLATYLSNSNSMTLPVWLEGQMSIKEAQVAAEAEEITNFSALAMLMILPLIMFAGIVQRVLTRRTAWKV